MIAQAASSERRWSLRKSGVIAATIISDRIGGAAACVVRDLSATGARLTIDVMRNRVITGPRDLPNMFTLVLERDNVEVDCSLAWRTDGEVGVRFLSQLRPLPKRIPIRVGSQKTS
jgi:hypothetical protein